MSHAYRPDAPVEFPKTNRDKNLDLLGAFHYAVGGLALFGSIVFIPLSVHWFDWVLRHRSPGAPTLVWPADGGVILGVMGGASLAINWTIAALMLIAGRCIRRRRAHLYCLIVAGVSCLSVPAGTVLGVFTLVLLTKPEVRAIFATEAAENTEPPIVRPWILALGLTVAIAAGSFGAGLWIADRTLAKAPSEPQSPPDTREARARAPFLVAFSRIPSGLPLLGPVGSDADGYPTQYVDRPGFRSLLHARRFKALDDYADQLQTAFEADSRKEYWPSDMADSFASAERELDADLDSWVASSPGSFAAHLARGSHRLGRMWAMRGTNYVNQTPAADLTAMHEAGALALQDLDEALRLRPRLVAAMRQEIRVASVTGNRERLAAARERVLEACPSCLQPRAALLGTMVPRWGGKPGDVRAFAATSPVADNPRLKVLAGYEDLDRAEVLRNKRQFDDALQAVDRACAAGEYWEYRLERARILSLLKRYDEAQADLDAADAQRHMHPAILAERAFVEDARKAFLDAGRDLLATLRIEPSSTRAKEELPYVLNGVLWQAQKFEEDHQHTAALEASELGLDLGPTDPKAHAVHVRIVIGDATTPERIDELTRQVRAHPDDFQSVQQLDYALSKQNRYAEILVMWDAYLAAHPDDGRAYLERSGTSHHLGKTVQWRADAARACELGMSEGCERAAAP